MLGADANGLYAAAYKIPTIVVLVSTIFMDAWQVSACLLYTSSFRNSFNQVFQIRPQQLQLGFLKVLKGSSIHKQCTEYGILYTPKAPFEVLQTNWLAFDDILFLKDIEDMVEIYYNLSLIHICKANAILKENMKLNEMHN